ncbi:hypothetical protein HYALB_00013987 [Hymenoscyphus albidus]|uniref:Lignostilbene dioxygenase n=1 Tax=Hymenoscyphus albidus TaxID=595503 RepID=A0A9N9LY14_9HELO|nr:hypothetical protein HYALB_00013987 [Hymenoscyphus albidus]
MAHLSSFVPMEGPNYEDGLKASSQIKYPDNNVALQGFNRSQRFEGDIFDLEVTGRIPEDINGTFYRIQPDHRFPPIYENDISFNGDGLISAFYLQNGHVDFRQRYVRTERFKRETAARRSLFGKYRNLYTDNESVKGVIRTASNTNVVFWRGMLLAMKEDGPPYAMDPVTLETIGRYDFEGQVESPTFTAHPKFDPITGEMKTEETWYKAPFCGVIHDCGISKNYVVLPMTPLKCSHDRLKKGGNHWAWDPSEDQLYGIVPRRGGKPEDIVWLRGENAFHGHVAGCYENTEGHIVFDLTVASDNVFWFFPEEGALPQPPSPETLGKRQSDTYRWIFDPKAKTNTRVQPFEVFGINGEFSRIDDRYVTKPYDHFWQLQIEPPPKREFDFRKCGKPVGGLFNVIGHFSWSTKTKDTYWANETTTFQEPVFVPKGTDVEGDGYLIMLLNHLDELRNDILIFDALNLAKGPLAAIHLPFKLRLGVHGNFVDQREIDAWKELRKENGEVGPVKPAEKPLPWQEQLQNGSNGTSDK